MKRKRFVVVLLSLLVLPIFLFSACSTTAVYTKQTTGKNASDYFYSIYNDFTAFQTISNNYTQVPLLSIAQSNKKSASWTLMDNTNKENVFALTAIDMFTNEKSFDFYDLSCLSSAENSASDNLSNFSLTEKGSTSDRFYYYYNLSGLEESGFMPTPSVINRTTPAVSALVDDYDFYALTDTEDNINIALWGNYLKLTVYSQSTSTVVDSAPVFAYPSAIEVPNLDNGGDVKIVRNDPAKTISIVYVDSNGQTYTKEINFNSTDSTGKTKKVVTKYLGDRTDTNATPTLLGTYEYQLTTATTSNLQITGTFETLYDKTNSYLYCKHTKGSVKVTSEFYYLTSNVVLSRYHESILSALTVVDFVIKANGSSANLKYKTIDRNGSIKLISQESTLPTTYGELTTEDKQGTNPVIAFNYSNLKIQYESVN